MVEDADVIVVGGGLAGLVATAELAAAGRKVIVVDQEPEQSLGGQAFWSFGGLFFVDSPEQRRMKIRDSRELAWQDWQGSAGFDREEDNWPRKWAEAYVNFAAGEKRSWVKAQGIKIFPIVGWAERGGYLADGHGNSVPRFHITWGTGPGVIEPFVRRLREGEKAGRVSFRFRHQVTGLLTSGGRVEGVQGAVLEPSSVERGQESSRVAISTFELHAQAVIVTSGGIGGNHDKVRAQWPKRLGTAPKHMVSGVPHHVDGKMLDVVKENGGRLINPDRMWHYPEGIINYDPIWPRHAIRILAGPSPLWLDAHGNRLPQPLFPGFDSLGALEHIVQSGHEHSWFLLNQTIIKKEFALSGSEQNPDLTERNYRKLAQRLGKGAPPPVEAFKEKGVDFIVRHTLAEIAAGMNQLAGGSLISAEKLEKVVRERDAQVANGFCKDAQIMAIHSARNYLGDKIMRTVKPHPILDPKAGPLIAVRLHILTRKSLGGLETDLQGRVLRDGVTPVEGLYAAGEASGFGGGGMHGYRALEGTFLGGCLFSGRMAGRAAAAAVA